jgi:hypothetical protein
MESVDCQTDSSIVGYDVTSSKSKLTTDEKFWWFAYEYGRNRAYHPGSGDDVATDPNKLWFMPRLVAQAEVLFLGQLIADRCVRALGENHCQIRWHTYGMFCFEQCKARIPDYVPPELDSKPVDNRSGKRWEHRVAAAYRWAEARGETMPVGLRNNSQEVCDLVARHDEYWNDQFKPLTALGNFPWRDAEGNPTPEAIEYFSIGVGIAKAAINRFVERTKLSGVKRRGE